MNDTYVTIDPFALQRGQTVQVRTQNGEAALCAAVNLVDVVNRYVSVIFDGGSIPVALPVDDWRFEVLDEPSGVPQEDGLFVRPEEVEAGVAGASALYRRQNGVWNNLLGADPTAVIAEEDLPPLVPIRPYAAPATTTTNPVVPPAEEPEPTPEEPTA